MTQPTVSLQSVTAWGFTRTQLEVIKTFWRKELTEGCLYYPDSDDFAEVYKLISDKEYCIKYTRISDWYFGSFLTDEEWCNEILWHIPHLEDVFRLAKEKWYLVEVDVFKSSFTKEYIHDFLFWKNWDNHSIRIIPEISILNQPESVLIQLLNLFK